MKNEQVPQISPTPNKNWAFTNLWEVGHPFFSVECCFFFGSHRNFFSVWGGKPHPPEFMPKRVSPFRLGGKGGGGGYRVWWAQLLHGPAAAIADYHKFVNTHFCLVEVKIWGTCSFFTTKKLLFFWLKTPHRVGNLRFVRGWVMPTFLWVEVERQALGYSWSRHWAVVCSNLRALQPLEFVVGVGP